MSKRQAKHRIKILPEYYNQVERGCKRFEIRKDDRNYKIGDSVVLKEWEPELGYTSREITVEITYVLRNCPEYGLMNGYCIFGW